MKSNRLWQWAATFIQVLVVLLSTVSGGNAGLLLNGTFENGVIAPWSGATDTQVQNAAAHGGLYGVTITHTMNPYQDLATIPGRLYVFTGWYRWTAFDLHGEWGYDHLTVTDTSSSPWQTIASVKNLHLKEQGDWHQVALTFVAPGTWVRLSFGLFASPSATAELSFDDFDFYEKTGNLEPSVEPVASINSGSAPLTVHFEAHAVDPDGAIAAVRWDFGDGSTATSESAIHTFIQKGLYPVRIRAWDNEGAVAEGEVMIDVTGDDNPTVAITGPLEQETWADRVIFSGTVTAVPAAPLESLTWDNLSTDQAGSLVLAGSAAAWSTEPIELKPGYNELLFTAFDAQGHVGTKTLVIKRLLDGPQISSVQVTPKMVRRVYEKIEVSFDLLTVAAHPYFSFDPEPPPGVPREIGVTVEGIVTTPTGEVRQPGFLLHDVERQVSGDRRYYVDTGRPRWQVRFSPQIAGLHTLRLRVQDASGTSEVTVGSFDVQPPLRKGYIGVSQNDPRYFVFTDGDLFWPIGPATGPDYSHYRDSGQNLERPWMAGSAAYSSNWARWHSSALVMGNEGYDQPFSLFEHYPSHELSRQLVVPGGSVIRIGFGDEAFRHRLHAGITYQVKLRAKVIGLSGPVDAGVPSGLMIKVHGWVDDLDMLPETIRSTRSLIPPIASDRDWHTVVGTFTASNEEAAHTFISLLFDNVDSGAAYIDQFSIRQWDGSKTVGGELIRQPLSDLHTYVEQRPAAFFDDQIGQGEENGVFFKFVVHDKRDWIQNNLLPTGTFAVAGGGYFQPEGTRARWLLEQWWRYLSARWGYSTAVHSWELLNEGSPTDPRHYRMAEDFSRYLEQVDSHPHLSTTSFWCCWEPEFWGSPDYASVDYGDIHDYTEDTEEGLDMAAYIADLWGSEISAEPVGKPVVLGETGIGSPGQPYYEELNEPNPGIWYHNLLWAGISSAALAAPNYWWSEHLRWIDRKAISAPFHRFVHRLGLQQGGYVDASAVVSTSNGSLRAIGQKHPSGDKAYLWLHNRGHTWRAVRQGNVPVIDSAQVLLTMAADKTYLVEWYNTFDGTSTFSTVTSESDGEVRLTVTALSQDIAVRILPNTIPLPPHGSRLR